VYSFDKDAMEADFVVGLMEQYKVLATKK